MESRERPADSSEKAPVTGHPRQDGSEDSHPRERDTWDKLEILLRPTAAFLAAITVALIGWFGQQALNARATQQTIRDQNAEKEITRRTQISENYRLYTQLLSNREDAESALRKDIFSSILKEFLSVSPSGGGREYIRNRLLKLEILALNFGESLSLSPLFVELDKNIRDTSYGTEYEKLDKLDDRKRLESLAKRVSDQQISELSTGGISWDIEIPFNPEEDDSTTFEYVWPKNFYKESYNMNTHQKTLEGITRNYVFSFSNVDSKYHTVTVNLNITKADADADDLSSTEQEFTLNYFNFPMVDNTRLSNDQRFALIMNDFGDKAIHVSAIVFPGKYSGQRDKPFLDDVISRLNNETSKHAAEALQPE